MTNFFESPFRGKLLSEQVTNRNIVVGRYSYYSGWYHGHSFDDCARYLMPDRDALLVEVGDVPALAAALHRALHDAPTRERLVHAGHEVAARYSWSRSAARHLEVYAGLGATPVGARG